MKFITLKTCNSTNDVAKNIIKQKSIQDNLFIISTDRQTAGVGKMGKTWEAEPTKNLSLSIVVQKFKISISKSFIISEIASIAIFQTLSQFINTQINIKWPNDIIVKNKKIAGILIETITKKEFIESVIIGIGINVNQACFINKNAISIFQILKKETSLEKIRIHLCKNFISILDKMIITQRNIHTTYLDNLYSKNESKIFEANNEQFLGKIKDVTTLGLLEVEKLNGILQKFKINEIKMLQKA